MPSIVAQIMVWDMRGGTQGSLTLGPYGPSHRSLLSTIDLGNLVNFGLLDADLPTREPGFCSAQGLRLNPVDQNILAFCLLGGKAGKFQARQEPAMCSGKHGVTAIPALTSLLVLQLLCLQSIIE